jgi:hypothetical protein
MKFSRPGHANTRPDFFFRILGNLQAKREIPENSLHISPKFSEMGYFRDISPHSGVVDVIDIFEKQIFFCHKKEGSLCH